MCGIAGIIGANALQYEIPLKGMLSLIEHRGRPGTLYEIDGIQDLKCFLGTNRLPIVQQGSNRQPGVSPDSTIMVAMNGQIFNYRAIQSALIKEGLVFNIKSPGDTVVLAAALQFWGISKTLANLVWEGVFLAIDSNAKTLFAARDHIGIKPLYYCKDNEKTYFASELKAFKRHDDIREVHQIEPGTFIEFSLPDGNKIQTNQWWSISTYKNSTNDPITIEQEAFRLLKEAIKLRVPEGPYAILLSGGLDSSLILKIAVEFNDLVTAYVLCRKHSSPDLPYARQICQDLGVKLIEVEAAEPGDMFAELPDLISRLETWEWHVVNHAAPMDQIFSVIRKDGHKVVLTGEGADELFFGYNIFSEETDYNILEKERILRIQHLHRTNCQRIDRMGMAHGLECRVPFLDKTLTEFALSIPAQFCLTEDVNKKPLRDIAKKLLPSNFSKRKKLSFARGVGYEYGTKTSQSVFELAVSVNKSELNAEWKGLARYPLEELFLKYFLDAGYDRASYLKERSI